MKVFVHVEKNPESNAALQALYSRSPKSVVEQAEKLSRNNFSGSFMERVFIGYGHESVGELGYTTLYFEGISFLAEKAIQDFELYVGQACSSRYIDFSRQPFVNPYDFYPVDAQDEIIQGCSSKLSAIQEKLRTFYVDSQIAVFDHLAKQFPNQTPDDEEKTLVWQKTIKARVFDVLRGFLPAGATTNVSWTVNLRNANARLILLSHHPLTEVQVLAAKAYVQLHEEYPNSFRQDYSDLFRQKLAAKTTEQHISAYLDQLTLEGRELFDALSDIEQFYEAEPSYLSSYFTFGDEEGYYNSEGLGDIGGKQSPRVKKAPIPRHNSFWRQKVTFSFDLDYGSYRDLQRHRNGYVSMPVLDPIFGSSDWYKNMLPEDLQDDAEALMTELQKVHNEILFVETDNKPPRMNDIVATKIVQMAKFKLQYAVPLCTNVDSYVEWTLKQAAYVTELRTGKTVHATLRRLAQRMAEDMHNNGVQTFSDLSEDELTLKRGTQDIEIRTTDDES